jgi:hypothetical protein
MTKVHPMLWKHIHALALCSVISFVACGADDKPPIKSATEKVFDEGDKPKADKSGYNLFRPTPKDQMRDLNTDRPDQTESPITVDAGHFQVEWNVFAFTRDRTTADHSGERSDNFQYMAPNFKMGLTNRIDLQFVFDGWQIQNERSRNEDGEIFHETRQGIGDFTTRLKINVFGNDGGKVALGVMPFIKLPTNQEDLGNNDVEGGLIIPVGVELPKGWGMGFMTEIDIVRGEGEDHYHTEFLNTITFSHDIWGSLDGYVEFAAAVNTEDGSKWAGQVDAGMNYSFTDDIKLDWGVNIGVTRSAPDVQPFLGLTLRF